VDIENDIMTGTADGELHAWNRVLLDGDWYQLDATWDDPIPDRGDFAGHTYFNVTDDIMDDTHTWVEENFEECTSWKYNYFEYNNLICNNAEFTSVVTSLAYRDRNGVMEIVLTDYDDNYDMSFLAGINGIESVAYSEEDYGDYDMLTIYLNQNE
jgi:transglutaminase/protease-like cytokinesis protein 3